MSADGGMLFQRLRLRLWNNGLRQLFTGSFVRPLTILLCSIVVWVFVFVVSFYGFRFLVDGFKLAPDEQIIGTLLTSPTYYSRVSYYKGLLRSAGIRN